MKNEKRRQRGSGSIFRKLPNKRWFIQFYKHGKRIREATGMTEWAEAQKLLRQRLHEVDKNEYVERRGKAIKVEELFATLRAHHEINRPKGVESVMRRWKHLGPEFAHIPATQLTTDDIARYVHRRKTEEGAANATINRELATLKRMFNLGRQSTPPKVQFVPYISMLKEDNVRRGFVEDGDFSRLAAEAPELWLRTFIELAFTYGWRKGELLGLRVRQVNLANRTIRLDAGATKNREGREVAMTAKVAELLRLSVARKAPDAFVLTRADGQPVRDFREAWKKLCVRAGLGSFVCRGCGKTATKKKCECGSRERKYQGLIVHDFRRSAAKALRRAGVPESVIMSTGGWKTPAMFRRYAIVSSADQRDAMEMLEKARAAAVVSLASAVSTRPEDVRKIQ